MADLDMCDSQSCELRKSCYRNPASGAEPNPWRQFWIVNPDEVCAKQDYSAYGSLWTEPFKNNTNESGDKND